MPGKPPISKTLFYTIALVGGGKLQEAWAGVDYINVNFHTDNFAIIDKVIDVLLSSPVCMMWTTPCRMSCVASALTCSCSLATAKQYM